MLKAAAKGGSRHEAHTLSTKSDGHWHIKKSPTTAGENFTHEYELFNHLNTAFNTYTPVRAFRTGVFCCSKNFLKKIRKSSAFFSKGSIAPRKGGGKHHQLSNEKGGGGENVEPNRREFIKQCALPQQSSFLNIHHHWNAEYYQNAAYASYSVFIYSFSMLCAGGWAGRVGGRHIKALSLKSSKLVVNSAWNPACMPVNQGFFEIINHFLIIYFSFFHICYRGNKTWTALYKSIVWCYYIIHIVTP